MDEDAWTPGYPHDQRSDDLRLRDAANPFGDFESVAARVVARATGARVILWDDNSVKKMPDLRIQYPKAPELDGYGEVVIAVENDRAALHGKLMKDGPSRREEALNWGWFLTLSPTIRLDRDWGRVVDLLAALERVGYDSPTIQQIDPKSPSAELRALHKLGVIEIASAARNEMLAGTVELLTPPWGGRLMPDWEGFQSWLATFLASPTAVNKREKLAASASPQRHLFVGVSNAMPWAVLQALDHPAIELPPLPPPLPDEITHLWLMGMSGRSRCITWWPEQGWIDCRSHWRTA